ncbi:MAG: SBBP repeat-containing protein, partial [candidate division WOR-3 bacterium]
YLAHCPDGILFVKSYRKVIIKDIYPGIDWIFRYDGNGNFHHEFELRNPQLILQINIKVKYADIELADNGKSIILSTPIGKIKDGSLIGYQGNNLVEVNYRLIDNNLIAFDIKNFDKDKSLLIDPHALIWSTYYGGSDPDYSYSITTDANGNVFVTGYTQSSDFPTQDPGSGAYYDNTCGGCPNPDGFILKFTNSGSLIWSTYYGGSSSDNGYSIATDANGNVFVTGITWSTDFPTQDPGSGAYFDNTLNGSYDAFILKFTNSGELKWATYYGGSDGDADYSITTDASGNIFIIGNTSSTDFPIQDAGGGAYYQSSNAGSGDAFISKFSSSSSVSERNNYYYYRDKLTLNLKSLSTPITIKIYSLDGKLIYSNIFKTNSIEINLKSLKPGIYILKAYSKDNKQLTYKFIKN